MDDGSLVDVSSNKEQEVISGSQLWIQRAAIASLLWILAQLAGLASIAIEMTIAHIYRSIFGSSVPIHVDAPIVEETMKALVFIFLVRYRAKVGLQIGDDELILGAWWIGACFGFYEWSAHELPSLIRSSLISVEWNLTIIRVLFFRMFGHGAFTVLIGVGYWLSQGKPPVIVPWGVGFVSAIGLHAIHNWWSVNAITWILWFDVFPIIVELIISVSVLVYYYKNWKPQEAAQNASL